MTDRRGFSLVEVLVALVVLEIGLLGAVGMTWQAQRTVRATETHEAVTRAVEALADSLTRAGWTGPGRRAMAGGELRWSLAGAGVVTISFQRDRESRLEVGLPVGGSVGGARAP